MREVGSMNCCELQAVFASSLPDQDFRHDQCFMNNETLVANRIPSGQPLRIAFHDFSFQVIPFKLATVLPGHVLLHSRVKRALRDQVPPILLFNDCSRTF